MLRILVRTVAVVALALVTRAHNVFPTSLSLRPGGEDFIYVADQGTCPATITVTSTNPAALKVFSVNMTTGAVVPGSGSSASVPQRVDQVFLVRADTSITTATQVSVQVCWIGADYPNAPCNENNCSPFAPQLVSVTIDPALATSAASPTSAVAGDPVQTARGELFLPHEPDLDLGGPLTLEFRRYYASRVALEGAATSTLGPGWLHNFAWRVVSTGNNLEVRDEHGRALRFQRGYLASAWAHAPASDVPYQLVDAGGGHAFADPLSGLVRTFNASGRLVSVSDGRGNTLSLSYAGSLLSSVSDGLGRTLTFTHTAGRLTAVSDGARSVLFGYDGAGRLSSATDAGGNTTTYAYDAGAPSLALLTSLTRPEGNTPFTQVYDASSRVAAQSDALGRTTTLAYDTVNHLTTVTDALGRDQEHDHDADGDLTRWGDEGGSDVTLQNDVSGRRTAVTDRLGRMSSWTLHAPSGRIARVTEANGAITTYSYALRSSGGFSFHDLVEIEHADGLSESFGYDASGNRTSWIDRAGQNWGFTYNARGQVLSATNPLGGVSQFAYNADGTLASITAPDTTVTNFGYDALRRVQVITHPDATTRTWSYDALDRVVAVTDEAGATREFEYDLNGNVVEITDASTNVWAIGYDALDRIETLTDPLAHVASLSYDELGRVAGLLDATGKGLALNYDLRGRLSSAQFASGPAWSATHDLEGAPTASTAPDGASTNYQSDALGRVTRVTTPSGSVSQRSYDALGRITRLTDPAGKVTQLSYAPRGGVASVSLPTAGASAIFTRNALGQITRATLPGAAHWDSAFDSLGRLTQTTDPLGRAISYDHDSRRRVEQATFPGTLGSVSYEYDGAGRLTRRNYSDGTDIDYVHDAEGAVTATDGASFAYDAARRMTACNGLGVAYDEAGRISSITYAPGQTVQYDYDARGRNTQIVDWFAGITTLDYDDNGRITRIARPNGVETSYEFDADGRLARIHETRDTVPLSGGARGLEKLSDISLDYDITGRIRSASRATPLSAKPADEELSFQYDMAQQVQGWSFDALGRTLGDGMHFTAQYDLASRVTQFTADGQSYDFDYDGFDNLVGWNWNGDDYGLKLNYSFGKAMPAQLSINGGLRYSFVSLADGSLLSSYDHLADSTRYYHYDERGSTLFRTGDDGSITDRYAYHPLGGLLARDGGDENWFRHRGRYGAISLGDGRFQYDSKSVFDTCTLRYLAASSSEFFSFYGTLLSLWFAGDSFLAPPERDATTTLDRCWLGELGAPSYRFEPKLDLGLDYHYDDEDDGPPVRPILDLARGAEVPSTPQIRIETKLLEGANSAIGLGLEVQIGESAPRSYREAVLKFRAARALVQQLRPSSARVRHRQLLIDTLALNLQTLVCLDSGFGGLTRLLFARGPSEIRGALQDPEALRARLSGPLLLSDVPFLSRALITQPARSPLSLLIRPTLVPDRE